MWAMVTDIYHLGIKTENFLNYVLVFKSQSIINLLIVKK